LGVRRETRYDLEEAASGGQPRGDPLHRGAAGPVGTEDLPEKGPDRQHRGVEELLPGGPFLLEDRVADLGREDLAQAEIEVEGLLSMEAKDLVPESGCGRVGHERPPCSLNVSWTNPGSGDGGLFSIPFRTAR
jgi:hypothetical protein